jgi:hypothetical protein
MKYLLPGSLLFLMVVICSGSSADVTGSRSDIQYAGSAMWGATLRTERFGNYLYCGMVNGLQILDISDSTAPVLVNRLFLNDNVWSLTLAGNRLYVGCLSGRLLRYDLSNPTSPVVQADTVISPGDGWYMGIHDIEVTGDTAYLATGTGLHIIDMTDANHPREIGAFRPFNATLSVRLIGDTVLLSSTELYVVDVSDPTSPTELYSHQLWGEGVDLEVRGALLYVADKDYSQPSLESRLVIFSLSVPDTLIELGSYAIPGYLRGVEVIDYYAYCATEYSGIVVLDVSDSSAPEPVACVYPPLGEAQNIEIDVNLAFVANVALLSWEDPYTRNVCADDSAKTHAPSDAHSGDLVIMDIADRSAPQVIGQYPFFGWPYKLALRDDLAYICTENGGLTIVDVTNPEDIQVISRIDTYHTEAEPVIIDSLIVIAGMMNGIQIVSASNPSEPSILGSHTGGGFALGVAAQGNCLYVANYPVGLVILDISDPRFPDSIGSVVTPGEAVAVAVSGDYAYIAAKDAGLYVIDVSNPRTPTVVGRYGGFANGLLVNGDVLIVNANTLKFLDISAVPSSLEKLGEYAHLGSIYSMALSGQHLFLALGDKGVDAIDISDCSQPVSIGTFDTPGLAVGVGADSAHVFVADTYSLIALDVPWWTDVVDSTADDGSLPSRYELHQNYPNPLNPETTIEFLLPQREVVDLSVFNALGQHVTTLVQGEVAAGTHAIHWDGTDQTGRSVASGVYFYQLQAGKTTQTKKMVLLK